MICIFYTTELCLENLNDLSSVGLIEMDEDINFKPTGKKNYKVVYYLLNFVVHLRIHKYDAAGWQHL